MEFPEDIRKLVREARAKKLADAIRERVVKKERRAAREAERKWRLTMGVENARFIFAWAKQFAADKTGKGLIKISSRCFLGGVMFFDKTLKGYAFRGLGVSLDGVWWIRNGCGAYPQDVESPEALAEEIDPAILEAAASSISSGEVWEIIKNRWELRDKL